MTHGNDHARIKGIDADGCAARVYRAVEDERARIARELHDELGALFAAARLDLHALACAIPENPVARARLAALERTVQQGIDLKTRLIEGLRPSALSLLGLPAALEEMMLEFSLRFSGDVECDLPDALALPEDIALVLYRSAQEALTNICKHAGAARRVRLMLKTDVQGVTLIVDDDGIGFDPRRRKRATHGLQGIHARIAGVGGQLALTSAPGAGTRLRVTLPRSPAQTRPSSSEGASHALLAHT